MSELAELLERFRRGPEILAVAITGAAGSEVDYAPEGKWSVRQIVAHVADTEIVASMRFRQVLAENEPKLQAFEQGDWARSLDYNKRKPSASLDTFRHLRTLNYELLKDVDAAGFERKGMHSQRGPITLLDMVRGFADHAESHARQVRELRAAYKEAKKAQGTA